MRTFNYDQDFFDDLASGSSRSASLVVPIVNELVEPKSVLDLGCGTGSWLREWLKQGVSDVLGVDGEYVNRDLLTIPGKFFKAHDLTMPIALNRRFDLAMSLEVAEHLPKARAEVLVDSLVRHSNLVLFSAAVPGQGGTHHVNEQWPSYWMNLFEARGYSSHDPLRHQIWSEPGIEFWYRQNIIMFAAQDSTNSGLLSHAPRPIDIVHPELYRQKALQSLPRELVNRAKSRIFQTSFGPRIRSRVPRMRVP